MSEIIELTENSQLRVEQDSDVGCPRLEMDVATGFVKIAGRGDSRLMDVPAVHYDDIPIELAHSGLATFLNKYGQRDNDEGRVERWARIFHDRVIEYDAEHGGYWFVPERLLKEAFPRLGDDREDWLSTQRLIIENERATYKQWADGDVSGVILERKIIERVETKHWDGEVTETEREDWEHVDSLWGCYLDDDYTAERVALEHFDLTDAERAAIESTKKGSSSGND